MSGHLLLSPAAGGPLRMYDVRRVATKRAPSAALPLATLAAPPNAGAGACFAARGPTLVVGGGATCGEAWRYSGDVALREEEEKEEAKASAKKKEKPKRQASEGRRMFNRTK